MAKKKKDTAEFHVRVVYGFLNKLKIVLLGEVLSGTIKDGMIVRISFKNGTVVGEWEILEVLHMDFINQQDNTNFKGLILRCKNKDDFKLLQELRVYEETITVISKKEE